MENLHQFIENRLDFYQINESGLKQILPIDEKHNLVALAAALIPILYPSTNISLIDWETLRRSVLASLPENKFGIDLIEADSLVDVQNSVHQSLDVNLSEIAACEDISISSVAELYSPMVIYLDSAGNLTQKIPYWVAKMLLGLKILQDTGKTFQIVNLEKLPFHYEFEKKSPIYPVCEQYIELNQEESVLHEIYQYSEQLTKLFDQISFKLHDLNITKAKLLSATIENDDPEKIQSYQNLLAVFEEQEKKLSIPFLSDIKILNAHLFEDRKNLISSLQIDLNPDTSNVLAKGTLFQSGKQISTALKEELTKQSKIYNEILAKFDPILKEIKMNIERERPVENKSSLYHGNRFKLFSFDLNNLHNSSKEKFRQTKGIRLNIVRRLQTYFLPPKPPFKCFFFASKHLEFYKKMLPESDYVVWNIEEKIKRQDPNGFTVFCDVDTNLTAITYNFIEKYHSQIEEFVLGSGDKDLIIVCELAIKFGIPVSIIVADEQNLSHELRKIAKNVFELY